MLGIQMVRSKNTQPEALSVYPPVLGRTGGSQLLRLTQRCAFMLTKIHNFLDAI